MKLIKIISWILLLLLIAQIVTALGIRPAKTTLLSEETKEYTGQFWIVNNDHREFTAKISVEGEMGKYVILDTAQLSFRSDDDAKSVDFNINLPEYVPPGSSTANIIVQEEASERSSGISSRIILRHKIIVEGPYPDKYIEAKLNFHESGNQIRLVSEVENKGKKNIDSIKTTFYVNDKTQQPQVLETQDTTLKIKEDKLLDASVDRSLFQEGEFEVSAVTRYDDQQVEVIQSLILGKPEVDIAYFTPYFIAQKINPYSLDLLNKWNKEVPNVYVEIEVKKDNQKIDQFRTKSIDLDANALKRINDYFDARDKITGKYTFDMIVNFWNNYRMDTKTFHAELLPETEFNNKPPETPALTGKAVANTNESDTNPFILGGIIIIIILLSIGAYILWRYFHREEYQ